MLNSDGYVNGALPTHKRTSCEVMEGVQDDSYYKLAFDEDEFGLTVQVMGHEESKKTEAKMIEEERRGRGRPPKAVPTLEEVSCKMIEEEAKVDRLEQQKSKVLLIHVCGICHKTRICIATLEGSYCVSCLEKIVEELV